MKGGRGRGEEDERELGEGGAELEVLFGRNCHAKVYLRCRRRPQFAFPKK